MKKAAAILLVTVIVASLFAACASVVGTYKTDYDGGMTLKLQKGGKGVITYDGEDEADEFTWKKDGKEVELTMDYVTVTLKIEKGNLVWDLDGEEIVFKKQK